MACPCDRYACIGVVCFIVMTFSIIILFSNRVVVESLYKFSNQFDPATCRVRSVGFVPLERECTVCEYHTFETCSYSPRSRKQICRSRRRQICQQVYYPCLQVNITYDLGDGKWAYAMLHQDVTHLIRDEQCSYWMCDLNTNQSHHIIKHYGDKFIEKPANSTFTCYINMEERSQAINTHIVTGQMLLHGYIWPGLALSISFLTILAVQYKVYKNRKRQEREKLQSNTAKSNPEAVPLQSTNRDVTQQLPPPVPAASTYQQQGYTQPGFMPPQQYPAAYYTQNPTMTQQMPQPMYPSGPPVPGGVPIYHPPPGAFPPQYPHPQPSYPMPPVNPSPFIPPKV